MRVLRIPLRIVFYKDGHDWIARCLEFDLLGDGKTRKEAIDRMIEAIRIQVTASLEANNPANLFKPADGRFFEMFAAGKDVAVGEFHLQFDSVIIDEAEGREYLDSDSGCDADLVAV